MMSTMLSSFTAIAVAFSLIFSSAPVPNPNGDLYERAQVLYPNASITAVMDMESNIEEASLEVLDEILIFENANSIYYSSVASLKSLLTDVFNSTYKLDASYNISEGAKIGNMQISSDSNLSLAINEGLSLTAELRDSFWLDYNFTSLENFKCEIISRTPADTRYILYDLALLLSEEEKQELLDAISGSTEALSNLGISGIDIDSGKILDILRTNSTVTIDEKNHGQIVMTNENMKSYIIELMDITTSAISESIAESHTGIQPIEETIELSFMEPFKEFIGALNIFDDEKAIVSNYYFDDAGNLTGSDSVINFSFNLKEVWAHIGDFTNDMYALSYPEEELTPPADFAISSAPEDPWHKLPDGRDDFIFSIKSTLKYNSYGSKVEIIKPELTDLNTRNIYEEQLREEILFSPDYYEDNDYFSDTYAYFKEYGNAFFRNEISVPLRGFVESICYGSEEITFDNGKITVKANGETDLFETLEMTVGSNVIIKDGEEFTLSNPIYTLDGTTRLTEEFFAVLWNGSIEDITVYVINRDETGYYYETSYLICVPAKEVFPF